MKKVALYAVAALVSCVVFAVIYAPASLFWLLVRDQTPPGVSVYDVRGSIWAGTATVSYSPLPTSSVAWSTHLGPLLERAIALDLRVQGDGHVAAGHLRTDGQSTSVRGVSGTINAHYVNALAARFALKFSGALDVNDGSAQMGGRWPNAAGANFSWTGGEVSYLPDGEAQSYFLPPLTGHVDMADDNIRMHLVDSMEPVVDVTIKPDGWMHLVLRGHLFNLLTPDQPQTFTSSEVVLEVEQQVFQ
jgi:hypothetical protein